MLQAIQLRLGLDEPVPFVYTEKQCTVCLTGTAACKIGSSKPRLWLGNDLSEILQVVTCMGMHGGSLDREVFSSPTACADAMSVVGTKGSDGAAPLRPPAGLPATGPSVPDVDAFGSDTTAPKPENRLEPGHQALMIGTPAPPRSSGRIPTAGVPAEWSEE